MQLPDILAPIASEHLSAEEIDHLYKQALKRIEVARFGVRLDVCTNYSPSSEQKYKDLYQQYQAVEKDYQEWLASITDSPP